MDHEKSSHVHGDAPIVQESVKDSTKSETNNSIANAKTPVASKDDTAARCLEYPAKTSIPSANVHLRVVHAELSKQIANNWVEKVSKNPPPESQVSQLNRNTKGCGESMASDLEVATSEIVIKGSIVEKDAADENTSDRDPSNEILSETSLATQEPSSSEEAAMNHNSHPMLDKEETKSAENDVLLSLLGLAGGTNGRNSPPPPVPEKVEHAPKESSPEPSLSPSHPPTALRTESTMDPNEMVDTEKVEHTPKQSSLEPSLSSGHPSTTGRTESIVMDPSEMAGHPSTVGRTESSIDPNEMADPEKVEHTPKESSLEPSLSPSHPSTSGRTESIVMDPNEMADPEKVEHTPKQSSPEPSLSPSHPSTLGRTESIGMDPNEMADPEKVEHTPKESSPEPSLSPSHPSTSGRTESIVMDPNEMADTEKVEHTPKQSSLELSLSPSHPSTSGRTESIVMDPSEMAGHPSTVGRTESSIDPNEMADPEKVEHTPKQSSLEPSLSPSHPSTSGRTESIVMDPNEIADPEKVEHTPKESSPEPSLSSGHPSTTGRTESIVMDPNEMADFYSDLHELTDTNGAGVASAKSDPNYSPAIVPKSFWHDKLEHSIGSEEVQISVRIVVGIKKEGDHTPQVRRSKRGKKNSIHAVVGKATGEQKAQKRPGSRRRNQKSANAKEEERIVGDRATAEKKATVRRGSGRTKKKSVITKEEEESIVQDGARGDKKVQTRRESGRTKKKSVITKEEEESIVQDGATGDKKVQTRRESGRTKKKSVITKEEEESIVQDGATGDKKVQTRRAKKKSVITKEEEESIVQDSAVVKHSSPARRSRRMKAKPTNYNEDAVVIDNKMVDAEEADDLMEQNLGAKSRKGKETKATKKSPMKHRGSPAKAQSEKGLNESYRGRDTNVSSGGKNDVPNDVATILSSNKSGSANSNSSDRKRKQAVISDSDGEAQNGTKKEEVPASCPERLAKIFESDFKKQDKRMSTTYVAEMVDRVWVQTPKEIKLNIPEAQGENAEQQLFEWKVENFGESTLVPLAPVSDCPACLLPLLREDLDHKLPRKELGLVLTQRWAKVSKSAKDSLPREDEPNYFSKLKKWKLQHLPNAADEVAVKPSSQRKRSRPSNIEKHGDEKVEHAATQEGKKATRRSSQGSKKRPKRIATDSLIFLPQQQSLPASIAAQGTPPDSGDADATDRALEDPPTKASSSRSEMPMKKEDPEQFGATSGEFDATKGATQGAPGEASSSSKHVQKEDPNEFYVEEEAHLYHNPPLPSIHADGVEPKDLKPIPPPQPFETPPNTGNCKWSWDESQRILLADFSCSVSQSKPFSIDEKDERFFLQMMERNDITLISEGLISAQTLNPDYWKPEYLRRVLGHEFFHKFRRFDTTKTKGGFEKCNEVDGMVSMKVGDYIRYLEMRQDFFQGNDAAAPTFSFVNHEGKPQELHVGKSALYMIDVDTNRLLPELNTNFLESFRYHGVLPGGSHCLMNSVTSTARPFMGPNLYVTPPATFTHFHQDGHGTVDSGHLCISGFNEVVMLRRLTERHKQHALMILTGDFGDKKKTKGKKSLPTYFDGLYSEPHGDLLGAKPLWPSQKQIEKCREMGYCPTVCIVKPGQLIHINKGRLHAFRKMSTSALPGGDCHKNMREQTIAEHKLTKETLCVSIAWDWMYRGVSADGINREVSTVLEAVVLNRKNGRVSLAIPEFSLFQMAKVLNPDLVTAPKLDNFIGFGSVDSRQSEDQSRMPDSKTICRGILPSLRHTVKQQLKTMNAAASAASRSVARGKRVTIAKRPNTHEDPMRFPLDPYGNDGFACKLCSRELSNVYYHCDGCEILLSKDFNICRECYRDKRFMLTVQMHPTNPKRHASLNHTGQMNFDRTKKCPCKNGPACGHCGYCLGCSCRCHTWFTLHSRMFGEEEGKALLTGVESAAKCIPCDGEESKKYMDLLAQRLEAAARLY